LISIKYGRLLAPQQLRQLCDVGGDAPGLVAASRLALESERALAALVPDDGFRVG